MKKGRAKSFETRNSGYKPPSYSKSSWPKDSRGAVSAGSRRPFTMTGGYSSTKKGKSGPAYKTNQGTGNHIVY